MRKNLFFVCLLVGLTAYAYAQTVVYSDNFDTYTAGQSLCAQNNTNWTTWSNAPGSSEDALVSSEQALSGSNSMKVTGSNDIIYRFSNQTTGVFDVDFDYYIPSTGNGAYFNIQHYYSPGIQWAFECFFTNSGTGYISVAGATYNFTNPVNAWFHIKAHVDLDMDLISVYVADTLVQSWPFSYESNTSSGINQLGSINFYAGAPNNLSGTYYVDNFAFTEITQSNDGQFVFSPNSDIVLSFYDVSTGQYTLNLSNPGGAPVSYRIVPVYDIPNPNTTSQGAVTLTRAGTQYTGVLFNNSTGIEVAAGFTAEEIVAADLVGKQVNAINVNISNSDYMQVAKIRIYDMGGILDGGLGSVVYEQTFIPVDDINTIYLTTPYVLDGRDFWFGVYYEQDATETTHPSIGLDDAVTPHPYGNWYKTSVAWNLLNGNPSLTGNWMLSAVVDGTPINAWMSLSSPSGTLNANGQVTETIVFQAQGLGVYDGSLILYSTDLANMENTLDVSVSFLTGIDENDMLHITIYPNPAVTTVNLTGDNINRVEIYDMTGRKVWDGQYDNDEVTVDVHQWPAGTYMVRVTAQGRTLNRKIVVR